MTAPPVPDSDDDSPGCDLPEPPASEPLSDVWARVRDHKVLQWGLAYLGASLAVAHGGDLLGHTFGWPETINRLLLGVLIVGFPVALALAWYHGHRSLRTVGTGEATIIAILLLIGAGLLVIFVRPAHEETDNVAPTVTSAGPRAPTQPGPAALEGGASIAVLPFVNMSSEHEQDYFSDGLSEELLNELTHIPNLRVVGRTSSFAFKGRNEDLRAIGETLGVDHILEGSVRKAGENLRITAQLINPADGSHLWSGSYDRKTGDVFEIQEEIARTVAAAMRVPLVTTNLREGGTHNFEAYDAYLRAAAVNSDLEAIAYLERAVALDPKFAQAWLGLASSYDSAPLFEPGRVSEWRRKSQEAGDRALALAPESAGVKIFMSSREFEAGNAYQAELLLRAAHDLNPTVASGNLGSFLLAVGRPRDAIPILQAVRASDPMLTVVRIMLEISYEDLEDYPLAVADYRAALPLLATKDLLNTAVILRAMGQHDPVALRGAVLLTKAQPLTGAELPAGPDQVNLAMVALLDRPAAALAQLRRWSSNPQMPGAPFMLSSQAHWAAYFGDADLSLEFLRRMPRDNASTRSALFLSLWRPVEKAARRLPAFKAFVSELGLVKYWRTGGNWGDFCHPVGQADFECN